MTEEQAKISIKTGGKGPGGCVGREACDAFCNNPDNQETCFQFGKDNGMIPRADLQKMQEGQQRMKDSFSSIPPEVLDCITSSLGADVVEKMKTGSVIQRKDGDSINQCFQKFGAQERRPDQNQNGQGQQNQQGQPNKPGQPGQPNQPNQQIQPWADICKPDGNGNPTALACVDGDGKFVASAKVGSDGKPVCPTGSTAKCGDYEQQNKQGQPGGGPNQGQGFNPGSGQNGNGPGGGQGGQPGQPNQPMNPGQPGNQPGQLPQPGQPGQPGQPPQPGGQPGQPSPQQPPPQNPPPPTSLLQGVQKFLANIFSVFR